MNDATREETRTDHGGGATDQVGEGTRDIAGAEASELPNHGRNAVDTNIGKELARELPGETGGIVGDGTPSGLAGDADIVDANKHGGRGKN